MDGLGKLKVGKDIKPEAFNQTLKDSRIYFDNVHGFLLGNLHHEIYDVLIHNEYNMRYSQINELFSVCGLKNVCASAGKMKRMKKYFSETRAEKVDGLFCEEINSFFELRNTVAHSLNATSSVSSSSVVSSMQLMNCFVADLVEFLTVELA